MKKKIFNLKNRFVKFFWAKYLIIISVLSIFINDILFRMLSTSQAFLIKPLVADMLFVVIVFLPIIVIPKKWLRFYLFAVTFLQAIVVIANYIYYRYFGTFLSLSQLSQAGAISSVSNSIVALLNYKMILFFIMPILSVVLYRRNHYRIEKEPFQNQLQTFIYLLSLFVVTFSINGAILTPTDVSRINKLWNRESVVETVGVFNYQLSDAYKYISANVFNNASNLTVAQDNFVEHFGTEGIVPSQSIYHSILNGKDVFYIHFESGQRFAMGLKDANGVEVTPNLNRLATQSMYFDNFYAEEGYGTSSDTEFNVSTELYSLPMGTAFMTESDNTYISTEEKFNELGYNTYAFHGNEGDFWNRENMYKALGYDDFYSIEDYSYNKDTDTFGTFNGLSDEFFYKSTLSTIQGLKATDPSPIYSKLITLSNHHPFTDSQGRSDLNFGILETNVELTSYLRSLNYADYCLGVFLAELQARGMAANSAIVLYGDHDARLPAKAYSDLLNVDANYQSIKTATTPGYVEMTDLQLRQFKRVPLFIYTPDGTIPAQTITTTTGMVDLSAIVGDMVGFYNPYGFGVNTLVDKQTVYFNNGSIMTDEYYFEANNNTFYKFDGTFFTPEEEKEILAVRDHVIQLSADIVFHNMLKDIPTEFSSEYVAPEDRKEESDDK